MRFIDRNIDRHWAWIIVASSFFAHLICFGVAWTTGVFNAIFLEEFRESRVVTSWAGSLMPACMFIAGPLSSFLISRLGCRVTMMLGGVTSTCGFVLSCFAPNITVLYFTFGIITGLSFGAAHLAAITAVTFYFDKFRNVATGVAVTGVGVGTLIFPPLIRALVDVYSWRGAMLLLGAVSLNLCVCGALIRPVDRPELKKSQTSLDPTMFRKLDFWMLCMNNFLVCFGLSITYLHLTAYAENRGVDFERSALLVSGIGISNLVGRLAMGMIAQQQGVDTILLYLISFLVSGVAVACMAALGTFAGLLVMALLFGIFTAGIGTLSAPILADILGIHRFTGGYGFLSIVSGLGQMVGGPVAGLMYDQTRTYVWSFLVGGISMCLSSMFMIVPFRRMRSISNIQTTEEKYVFDSGQNVAMVTGDETITMHPSTA
ncbi:monocarboxylate transporter 13-like [Gigantopelta aegis]|uniref:monocarboxylate transporter 13-like n=1 Tax=Gigantopelta aegis TaxID=1735272 RepID=UPI001B8898B3|nr:monocarboxylate transporter 13-like [Gigantopelta aegis]XP_041373549.1 monocarboxylate transporter 13-like [Gigantopelta aegis]XP_041373550.1 monocarboxylate transporter 13-like [Gigantopelta aegis]